MDRSVFDETLNALLVQSQQLIPSAPLPDLPPLPGTSDVPAWHPFEHSLWAKGEEIRKLLLESRKKPDSVQLAKIIAICTNPNGRRGRQSFVLLLGKKCYAQYAPSIAGLLSDSDVNGQVIDTLYKMGTSDYLPQISVFTEHDRTWIRNAAKKYVQKYG